MIKKVLAFICIQLSAYSQNLGELYFQGNCITCHQMKKSVSAPSTQEFVQRYKSVFISKEDFVNFMSEWVYAPKNETSIMRDAIEKYEIMPTLAYDLYTLQEIAKYLYDLEFE